MRLAKGSPADGDSTSACNSLIDVVFLLLVFFLLSAHFLRDEKALSSHLPRKGTDGDPPIPLRDEVFLDLRWKGRGVTASARAFGAGGFREDLSRDFSARFRPDLGYGAPDFPLVEGYLGERKREFGNEVPVTVQFDDRVPVQMVVTVLDICTRLRLQNFGIAPK